MNNRYLYRAKRTDNGEWAEGTLLHKSSSFSVECDEYYIFDGIETSSNDDLYLVDPSTICQCTGLKDKNGKLIWENDIVRCGKNCTVTWCDTFASWRLNTSGWMYSHFFGEACKPEDVEIVGNIFDNPELLEAGE